jgi:hypothetical protein
MLISFQLLQRSFHSASPKLSLPGLSRQPMEDQAQAEQNELEMLIHLNHLGEVCTRGTIGRRNKSGDDRGGGVWLGGSPELRPKLSLPGLSR